MARKHPKNERSEGRRGGPRRERRAGPDLIYGTHAVLAALKNPARQHRRLMVTEESRALLDRAFTPEVAALIAGASVASRAELARLVPPGATHQGLILETEPLPPVHIEDLCGLSVANPKAPVVVLDQVSDPHNVGAILRSALAFGARGLVMQDRHAPTNTPALAKAAAGALETLPLARVTNLARALDVLKEAGFWCIGLDGAAEMALSDAVQQTMPPAIVLGAEGSGLRRLTAERCDALAHIPLPGAMPSLNVSNAAAIALYEITK